MACQLASKIRYYYLISERRGTYFSRIRIYTDSTVKNDAIRITNTGEVVLHWDQTVHPATVTWFSSVADEIDEQTFNRMVWKALND